MKITFALNLFFVLCSSIKIEVSTSKGEWKCWTPVTGKQVVEPDLHAQGYRYGGDTETSDTLRYPKTRNFPLVTTFTDANNVVWRVSLQNERDQASLCAPFSDNQVFHGDQRDQVGIDSNVRVACYKFYYQKKSRWSWITGLPHGIRLKTRGLIDETDKPTDNILYWSQVIDVVNKGLDGVQKMADIWATLKAAKTPSKGKRSALVGAKTLAHVVRRVNKEETDLLSISARPDSCAGKEAMCLSDNVFYQRRDCGYPGISQKTCEYKGCCYREESNQPWCYHSVSPDGNAEVPSGIDKYLGAGKKYEPLLDQEFKYVTGNTGEYAWTVKPYRSVYHEWKILGAGKAITGRANYGDDITMTLTKDILKRDVLTMGKGDFCDPINKERTTQITFVCGPNTRVRSIRQPTTCVYEIELETSLACSPDDEEVVSPNIDSEKFFGEGKKYKPLLEKEFAYVDGLYTWKVLPYKKVFHTWTQGGFGKAVAGVASYGSKITMELTKDDERRDVLTMSEGSWCDPIQATRETEITFVCGSNERVTKIDQPSICFYEIELETPLACRSPDNQIIVPPGFEEYLGDNNRYLPLMEQDFEYVDGLYTWMVNPYRNVYHTWAPYGKAVAGKAQHRGKKTMELTKGSKGRDVLTMDKGDWCHPIKRERKTQITFVCGSDARVTKIRQPTTCYYEIELQTPLACR